MQETILNINKIYLYKLFPTKSVLKYILLQANETNNYWKKIHKQSQEKAECIYTGLTLIKWGKQNVFLMSTFRHQSFA